MTKMHHWPDHLDPDVYFQREGLARRPRQERKTFDRDPVRREVVVKRLCQQGLTRHEAEEQWELRYW